MQRSSRPINVDGKNETKYRKVPRNVSSGENFSGNFSIFSHPGRAHGAGKTRYLDDNEYIAANNYVLFNCPKVAPYIEIFTSKLQEQNPHINGAEIDKCLERDFATWFKPYAQNASLVPNEFVRYLASGPLRSVRSVPIYFVNGYKFHTRKYGANKSTFNSGVCIKGLNYSEASNDYFGILEEILIIEYPRFPTKKTALFKCEWFDPTLNVGTRIHQRYNIVEIGWLVACKVKARPLVDMPQITESHDRDAFQDDAPEHLNMIDTDDIPTRLNDFEGTPIDLDDDDECSEEETQIDSEEEESSKTDDSDEYNYVSDQ
ncbi:hypothetical protein POM88_040050 [Heracleum sosnowskyi]|uniref:DUF4216 domain-containing protein n=1 Tax=Heracleum sosnowskyi TaxID=360622 RepID=A0AAD8M9E8_9APIA|nr:hypothetical protein POM88_040050 [Heracleum sosnowskyi]